MSPAGIHPYIQPMHTTEGPSLLPVTQIQLWFTVSDASGILYRLSGLEDYLIGRIRSELLKIIKNY